MDGFKYDKVNNNMSKKLKKIYNNMYPTYKNIQPDLIKLGLEMYNLEKEFTIPSCEEFELSLQETVELSKTIIAKYLGVDCLDYFNKMIKWNKIFFYDHEDKYLRDMYDGGVGSEYYGPFNEIYIPLENSIIDVNKLSHEFTHALAPSGIPTISSVMLSETGTLFLELLILEYLTERTNNYSGCYVPILGRIEHNYEFNYELANNILDHDYIYSFTEYSYDIGRVFSCLMYKRYLEDKESYLYNFKELVLSIGKIDFNRSMKILGFNIRYVNNRLEYDDNFFEELMNSYAEYVKMVEKKDLKLIKTKQRL